MKLAWLLMAAGAGWAQVNVPRPAPEFLIQEPSGRTTKLSSYRGDVVLLAFIVTSCSHCQAASKEFEKLQAEFGRRGFHAAEAAFDQAVAEVADSLRTLLDGWVSPGQSSSA